MRHSQPSLSKPGRRLRASTWSRIRAIRGETTSVTPVVERGGQLKAERLARAGGHDDEQVAPVLGGLHGLFLERAELA